MSIRTSVSTLLSILLFCAVAAASEVVRDSLETTLIPGGSVEYAVLLPDGYSNQGEPLPLLLMLHGGGGNREEIPRWQPQIDALWNDGTLPKLVVVTPSVPTGSIYIDNYDGSIKVETFMVEEFIPHLRKRFNVSSDRNKTMLTGISMGGLGGLYLAFKNPDGFGAVASMEPGVWPGLTWDEVPAGNKIRNAKSIANLFGDPFDANHWQSINPASIAVADPSLLQDLAIYFECGDDDAFGFHAGNDFLHRTLWSLRIRHEFRLVRWGDHVGPSVIERSLNRFRFLARYLKQPEEPTERLTNFRKNRNDWATSAGFKSLPYWPSVPERIGVDDAATTSSMRRIAEDVRRQRGVVRISNLRYDEKPGVDPDRLRLDVFTGDDLENAPVILFAHGGSWVRGDKRAAMFKPGRFVPAGYLFASMNYRFRPSASLSEMAQDVATATAWIKNNADKYGGDPDKIFLMGHSAGAHLVAAVGTNGMFLENVGLSLNDLSGVIPLDTAMYNITLQMKQSTAIYEKAFGTDPNAWASTSPWEHVSRGKGIPPFLLLISDGRAQAPTQPIPFAKKLRAAGIEADWFEAKGRGHGPLNTYLGTPGDESTEVVLDFIERNSN